MIKNLKSIIFILVFGAFFSACVSTVTMDTLVSNLDIVENDCYSQAIATEGFYSHEWAYNDNQKDVIKKIPPEKYVSINEKTADCLKTNFQASGYDFGNVALAYQKQFDDRITIAKNLISKKITLQEASKLLDQKQQNFNDYLISTDDFLHVSNNIKHQRQIQYDQAQAELEKQDAAAKHQQEMEYYQAQAELEKQEAAAWAALSPEERMAYIQAEALKDQANAIRESAIINSDAMQKSAQIEADALREAQIQADAARRAQIEADLMRNRRQKEIVTDCGEFLGRMRCVTQ
jgi:hypothetical protein